MGIRTGRTRGDAQRSSQGWFSWWNQWPCKWKTDVFQAELKYILSQPGGWGAEGGAWPGCGAGLLAAGSCAQPAGPDGQRAYSSVSVPSSAAGGVRELRERQLIYSRNDVVVQPVLWPFWACEWAIEWAQEIQLRRSMYPNFYLPWKLLKPSENGCFSEFLI